MNGARLSLGVAALVVLVSWLAAGPGLAAPGGQAAQPNFDRPLASVIGNAPNLGAVAPGSQATEVTVQWRAYQTTRAVVAPGEAVPLNAFEVVSRRTVAATPVRQRNPELSADQVVVVMADKGGRALAWTAITDPRILRAEFPTSTGELAGQVLHRAETEFTIAVPASLDVVQLDLYSPRRTDTGWVLSRLGAVTLVNGL